MAEGIPSASEPSPGLRPSYLPGFTLERLSGGWSPAELIPTQTHSNSPQTGLASPAVI